MRPNHRKVDELRPVKITRGYTNNPPGSVLVEFGNTRVLCTAMFEDTVPPFLADTGKGWLSAEYAMLPGSTPTRKQRDRSGKVDGRSTEIQRLIGRCLRAVVDTKLLGERTIWVDCDVIQADGGTRTVAITGAYVALMDAVKYLKKREKLRGEPVIGQIAAVSVGIVKGRPVVDLCYEEDSSAEVDANVVMLGTGEFVEVQCTAERGAYQRKQLDAMLDLAAHSIRQLMDIQNNALAD